MCIKGDVQIANWKSDEQKKKEIHDPDWNPVKVHVVVVLICSLQAITKAFDGKRKTEEKLYFIVFQRTQHWYTWIFQKEAQRSLCNSSRTTWICFHCLVHEWR